MQDSYKILRKIGNDLMQVQLESYKTYKNLKFFLIQGFNKKDTDKNLINLLRIL